MRYIDVKEDLIFRNVDLVFQHYNWFQNSYLKDPQSLENVNFV